MTTFRGDLYLYFMAMIFIVSCFHICHVWGLKWDWLPTFTQICYKLCTFGNNMDDHKMCKMYIC